MVLKAASPCSCAHVRSFSFKNNAKGTLLIGSAIVTCTWPNNIRVENKFKTWSQRRTNQVSTYEGSIAGCTRSTTRSYLSFSWVFTFYGPHWSIISSVIIITISTIKELKSGDWVQVKGFQNDPIILKITRTQSTNSVWPQRLSQEPHPDAPPFFSSSVSWRTLVQTLRHNKHQVRICTAQ